MLVSFRDFIRSSQEISIFEIRNRKSVLQVNATTNSVPNGKHFPEGFLNATIVLYTVIIETYALEVGAQVAFGGKS